MLLVRKHIELKITMLNEINQCQKDKYEMFTFFLHMRYLRKEGLKAEDGRTTGDIKGGRIKEGVKEG